MPGRSVSWLCIHSNTGAFCCPLVPRGAAHLGHRGKQIKEQIPVCIWEAGGDGRSLWGHHSSASCSFIQTFQEKLPKEANDDLTSLAFLGLKMAAGCKSFLKHVKLIPPTETPFFKAEKERKSEREGSHLQYWLSFLTDIRQPNFVQLLISVTDTNRHRCTRSSKEHLMILL